eukprot:scaffold2115_cov363-Pavlova_lutheri.AAC.3
MDTQENQLKQSTEIVLASAHLYCEVHPSFFFAYKLRSQGIRPQALLRALFGWHGGKKPGQGNA